MNRCISTRLLVLIIIALVACSSPNLADNTKETHRSYLEGELIFNVGEVQITVLQAQVRKSYQTHYLMTYAEAPYIYYEVILLINGDEEPLAWGKENLDLVYQDSASELILARPMILDDEVEYRYGEDLTHGYVYIYQVQENSQYDLYKLSASDGQSVSLASVLLPVSISDFDLTTLQGGEYDVLGGGLENLAAGPFATVAGGSYNLASAYHAAVGGGNLNLASASHATVAGGRENSANNFYSTVGGGFANFASGRDSTVAGGSRNSASNHHTTVSGGIQNQAGSSDSTVSGGSYNQAVDVYATVGGGTRNHSSGYAAVIAGGAGNLADSDHASIAGGLGNQASGAYASIGGGHGNTVAGNYAVSPGGMLNQVLSDFSFVAGYRGSVSSDHPGVFIFSDSTDAAFHSLQANEFAVRAGGGIRFVTSVDDTGNPLTGAILPPGSGAWSILSDRQAKANIEVVNGISILEKLSTLPLSTWNYSGQDDTVRHLGPMAQEFYAQFGFGESDRYISTVDADGVALASIQGLYQLVEEQQTQLASQKEKILELEARLDMLVTSGNGFGFRISGSLLSGLIGLITFFIFGWFFFRSLGNLGFKVERVKQ
ncbi:tail fiber domain-containing protein [Chloroflexota bacterium]